MESKKSNQASLYLWISALLFQNLVFPALSSALFEDQKNYYYPPSGSYHNPSHGSGGGHGSGRPSHGGGGSYGGSPPANCGNPPSGGGYHYNPTPSPPSGSGGGYSYTPPSSGDTSPTIPTPTVVTPPTILSPPDIPGISVPSPPSAFDPNSPPFTCIFWGSHPTLIWGLLGYWGTVGGVFGGTGIPGFAGSNMSLQEALSNTRQDPIGALYREGTASLLNSMVTKNFPYTTNQVKDRLVAALSTNEAAAAQAHLFKLANEGLFPKA